MAGTLVIDTLKASTGVLATQNGMTGVPKAWISFSMATNTINASFNIGSITKISTGQWYVNYSTAMPDANYASVACGAQAVGNFSYWGTVATSTTQTRIMFYNGGFVDAPYAYFIACGA